MVILHAALSIQKPFYQETLRRIKNWIDEYFVEFSMLVFVGFYWTTSLMSNLNIGVRHLLPVFPFTILLIGGEITKMLEKPPRNLKYGILAILLLWQVFSVISIYPHFLCYFNEITGGPDEAYIFTVNSNLDWGQDLRRLKQWVDQKGIDKIYIDYFGGASPKYYFKEKYAPWRGTQKEEELPKGNYLAVSASFLQGGRGMPGPGFNEPTLYYRWLDKYPIVDKVGYSIFIYWID
jgi:hypothetical protein